MTKLDHKQIETRNRILNAAKKEFAEKGLAGARTGSIAKRAEVNSALLHYYFSSKENLYKEVLFNIFKNEKIDKIMSYFQESPLTPGEKLHAATYLLVHFHCKEADPDIHRLILRELAEENRYLRTLVQDYEIPMYNLLVSLIEDGIEDGSFETSNPFLVILNLKFFTDGLSTYRELFISSQWGDMIYGEKSEVQILKFTLEHTFRALTPTGKELYIPQLNDETIGQLEKFILEFKEYIKFE